MSATTRTFLLTLVLAGCSCGAGPDGGADAGVDARLEPAMDTGADAYADDVVSTPDVFIAPDVFLTAPACGAIDATSCPTQSAASVSGCASGEGTVFFDGAHCQQAPNVDCGAERGAFDSFEECAVVCEAAGECDGSKIFFHSGTMPGCETPVAPAPACAGGWTVWTWIPLDPACEAFRDQTDCRGSPPPLLCGPTVSGRLPEWSEVWTLFRRASLLPFVVRLTCGVGGD